MRLLTIFAAILLSTIAVAQTEIYPENTAKVPDLSNYDADVLRTVATNLYRKVADLQSRLDAATKDKTRLMSAAEHEKLELAVTIDHLRAELTELKIENERLRKEVKALKPSKDLAGEEAVTERMSEDKEESVRSTLRGKHIDQSEPLARIVWKSLPEDLRPPLGLGRWSDKIAKEKAQDWVQANYSGAIGEVERMRVTSVGDIMHTSDESDYIVIIGQDMLSKEISYRFAFTNKQLIELAAKLTAGDILSMEYAIESITVEEPPSALKFIGVFIEAENPVIKDGYFKNRELRIPHEVGDSD